MTTRPYLLLGSAGASERHGPQYAVRPRLPQASCRLEPGDVGAPRIAASQSSFLDSPFIEHAVELMRPYRALQDSVPRGRSDRVNLAFGFERTTYPVGARLTGHKLS